MDTASKQESDKHRAALWAHELLAAGNFVVLDLETTGLNRDRDDQPVALAVVAPDGSVRVDSLVKPSIAVDPGAVALHGLTDELLVEAPGWEQIRPQLVEALRGQIVVIYNRDFDQNILTNMDALVLDHDLPPLARVAADWQCAMQRYAEFYGEWNDYRGSYRWQRLTAACAQQGIGVEPPTFAEVPALEKAHSALGDALRTLALVQTMAAWTDEDSTREADHAD